MTKSNSRGMKLKKLKGWVGLKSMEFHAYHGVHDHEKKSGGNFQIDLFIKTDMLHAANSDDLKLAVNYESLANTVLEEMQVPSSLLEHVAKRILEKVLVQHTSVSVAKIKIYKLDPPVNIPCRASIVKMKLKRNDL